MPRAVRIVRRSGRPVRLGPAGSMTEVVAPANDYLPKKFLAVDILKSSGVGFTVHLWGAGGTYGPGTGTSGYRAGYGAALVGTLNVPNFTVSVGSNDAPSGGTYSTYGEGKGGYRGGGGTGIRLANGTLFGVAAGGGGSYNENAGAPRYAFNGGDAGLYAHGGGQAGQGGRTYNDGPIVGLSVFHRRCLVPAAAAAATGPVAAAAARAAATANSDFRPAERAARQGRMGLTATRPATPAGGRAAKARTTSPFPATAAPQMARWAAAAGMAAAVLAATPTVPAAPAVP